MSDSNNHDDPEALAQADKELNAILDKSDIDNVFSTPQSTDNIRLLMTPGGDDPLNLYMRADIPNNAIALAFAIRESRCREHDDNEGLKKLTKMIAAMIGVSAKRANLASDTIIGEHHNGNMRRNLGDWIRDKAGLGDKE